MDLTYDEIRGNPALGSCRVSIARAEDLFQATEHALGWEDAADGDPAYAVLPIVRLEAALSKCRVELASNPPGAVVETCLHLFDFIICIHKWHRII